MWLKGYDDDDELQSQRIISSNNFHKLRQVHLKIGYSNGFTKGQKNTQISFDKGHQLGANVGLELGRMSAKLHFISQTKVDRIICETVEEITKFDYATIDSGQPLDSALSVIREKYAQCLALED